MINCNIKNRDLSSPKNILETNDSINQIKLMHKPNDTKEILIVLDDSGQIVVLTIDQYKDKKNKSKLDKYEVIKIQKYNPKIEFHDNSPWSVDCQYPYIIIGSNNRTVFVFNYEEKENNDENYQNNNGQNNYNSNNDNNLINNSFIYKGNNDNIPYVTISDNCSFIGNNSIDKKFKIFDFYTGELICSSINPNSEWGWGLKFLPKNLFKIKNYDFKDYEYRKNDNISCIALERRHMTDLNLTNPSTFDENNYNKVSYEDLSEYERYLKMNLIDKYYILSSCNNCAGLFMLDFKKEENNNKKEVIAIPIGKIELSRIYIRDIFMEKIQLDYIDFVKIDEIIHYSRYEFIYFSKNMNLFLLGSKTGDLQVFEMNIYLDKKNKMICVEDEPNILISFEEKIAGMRFIENKNENGRKIIDIFVLTLSGMFYYYKISPDINYWNSNFEED